jgi:hypothetical protein
MKPVAWTGLSCVVLMGLVTRSSDRGRGAEPARENWRRIDQTGYAGSTKCAACHQTHYDGWKETGHNKMIRPPLAQGPNRTVLADFDQPDPNRKFDLKDVKWVIGHRWKQRFIGAVNGLEVVYPAEWSVKQRKWLPYAARNDWWYPYHKDWKTRSNFKLCAGCHSTGPDHYTQSWTELNITCESCHGPGKAHAQKPKLDNIVNPARLSVKRSIEICQGTNQPYCRRIIRLWITYRGCRLVVLAVWKDVEGIHG